MVQLLNQINVYKKRRKLINFMVQYIPFPLILSTRSPTHSYNTDAHIKHGFHLYRWKSFELEKMYISCTTHLHPISQLSLALEQQQMESLESSVPTTLLHHM